MKDIKLSYPAPPPPPEPPAAEVETPAVVETPAPEAKTEEAPATPAAETPVVEKTLADEIAEHNAKIDAELEKEEGEEGDVETADEPTADEAVADADETPAVVFEDADDFDTFTEKRTAYLETVELTPELEKILARQDAELATARATAESLPASPEITTKVMTAFDKMFDTEIDEATGQPVPNTKPVVELLRTDYANEFRPLADEILGSDSQKYKGASMFEEYLLDEFGADKVSAMLAYAKANIPLPTIPTGSNRPAFVPETQAEAYSKLPEVKRFEIESLVNDIATSEKELETASEYYKEDIQKTLVTNREKLAAELYALEQIQNGLDGQRQQKERDARQTADNIRVFNDKVNTSYNSEIFAMSDAFIAEIAPNLTFADTDTQVGHARNINTRVANALAFQILDDGTFDVDPMADYYAKQLTEEGVKFDFAKGRDLLQKHYTATRKLVALQETRGASPQAIEKATKAKRAALTDIKAEQRELLGQITKKYVKSNASALEKDVKKLQEKKQAARPRIGGPGAPVRKSASLDPKDIKTDIDKYNREIDRRIASGDDLYELHAA